MTKQSFDLGPYFCDNPHHALLHHCLDYVEDREGIALEFGVGEGHSLRCIARCMPAVGFDSFEGLPEDWRPGFEKGMFAADIAAVRRGLPPGVVVIPGLFEETLPVFSWWGMRDILLIHIDCDLYSSTATVLEHLPWEDMMRPRGKHKPVIIFDEWWNYPEAEMHEQRAWLEFTSKEPWDHLEWEVLGCGVQQWAIELR